MAKRPRHGPNHATAFFLSDASGAASAWARVSRDEVMTHAEQWATDDDRHIFLKEELEAFLRAATQAGAEDLLVTENTAVNFANAKGHSRSRYTT
jgi:hypothetical protein